MIRRRPVLTGCRTPDYCPVCESGNDCSLFSPEAQRVTSLDALRGLAVVLMMVDHLALFTGETTVRATLGRLAMPLFFLLAGHLARGWSRRLAGVLAVAALLGVLAPWSGALPLLVTLVIGAVLLPRSPRHTCWLFVAVALGMLANPGVADWTAGVPGSYPIPALFGLMALGRLTDRGQLVKLGNPLRRLGSLLPAIGRRPLTWYAGHVLALTFLFHPFG